MNRGVRTKDIASPQSLQQWVVFLSQRDSDRLFLLWEGSYQRVCHLRRRTGKYDKFTHLMSFCFTLINTVYVRKGKKKSYHQRERRKFRHKAEQYVLEDLLSIKETRERQEPTGPTESINTGRSHFWTNRDLRNTNTHIIGHLRLRIFIYNHVTQLNTKGIPVHLYNAVWRPDTSCRKWRAGP